MSQPTGDGRWEFDNIGYYRQMVHWFYYFARCIDITVSYIVLFTRTLTGYHIRITMLRSHPPWYIEEPKYRY